MNTIAVGLQFGDEGKGKICDHLMHNHDICVRYSGGPNTGASVQINNKIYKFHNIPVGVIQKKQCYIASGCLINIEKLKIEIQELSDALGFDINPYLFIDGGCHIITDKHIEEDRLNEETSSRVGSTKNGIMPCTRDKFSRKGHPIAASSIKENRSLTLCNVSLDLDNHIADGKNILFEGSQGALLDINHGYYPYISTSNNVAGAACASCGIGPTKINEVIGIFKPYMTKVGEGPFPTKVNNEWSKTIAQRGHEFGTTTGRPRDIGYLDLDELHRAVIVNGCTQLAMTKGDVLEGLDFIAESEGRAVLFQYKEKRVISLIEEITKVPITLVSNGPDRMQTYEPHSTEEGVYNG